MNWRRAIACLVLLAITTGCQEYQPPDVALQALPDLDQFGREVSYPFRSETLCAPVAASNALAWLAGGMPEDAQWNLALSLASREYMATSRGGGTAPWGVIQGLERFVEAEGWEPLSFEYRGWRRVDAEYQGSGAASLAWLHAQLEAQSVVLLNLGWYESSLPGVFLRSGGHWVTLRGIKGGKLLIHDPGPWQQAVEPVSVQSGLRIAMRSHQGEYRWFPVAMEIVDTPTPAGERAFIDGALSVRAGATRPLWR